MKIKRYLSCVLTTIILVTTLASCAAKSSISSSTSSSNEPINTKKNAEVTLKIYMPGDRSADFDKIKEEAEKRMADTVNVKLDVVFVPWADLATKTQMVLASGESVDLIFDAPWNGIQNKINAGNYEPLEELLKKYGQDILKTTPQKMFDANKFEVFF